MASLNSLRRLAVAWNAGEGKPPALVSPRVVKKLHTPVIATGSSENAPAGTPQTRAYALGWGQLTEEWARRAGNHS